MTAAPKNMTRMPEVATRWRTTAIAPRFLVALLDEAGQPPDDVLAAAGLDREALSSADLAMPLDLFRELWARAADVKPDVGLTLLDRFPPGQMHLLAHLALRSATVQRALEDVCRYATAASPGERLELRTGAGVATLRYRCVVPGLLIPWMGEHMLAITMRYLASWTGRPLPVRAVRFPGPPLALPATYREFFGVAPQFDAEHVELDFAAEALAWPLLTHDAYLHAILDRVAAARVAPPDDVIDGVRQQIAQQLLQGRVPTLDTICPGLRLSPRSLRERLQQRDTTFRRLLDEVRRDLAGEQLGRGMSVTATAYVLGFSEPAAFQRACRRWFGVAAGAARRQLVAPRQG
jgi:AraC-like DNA-binding protein